MPAEMSHTVSRNVPAASTARRIAADLAIGIDDGARRAEQRCDPRPDRRARATVTKWLLRGFSKAMIPRQLPGSAFGSGTARDGAAVAR